jgi:hypothetical protein
MAGTWQNISNYMSFAPLTEMTDEKRRGLALVAGHFPYAATELLVDDGDDDLLCLTLLREPVERTASFLAQCRRHRPELRDQPLEAIYDNPWYFDRFIQNHQTRVFSMTLAEATAPRTDQTLLANFLRSLIPASAPSGTRARIESLIGDDQIIDDERTSHAVVELERAGVDMAGHKPAYERFRQQPQYWVPEGGMGFLYADAALTRPSPVDEHRFARALENLERCAVVGLTDDYPGFIRDLNRTAGAECSATGWLNAGDTAGRTLSKSFVRRIEQENRFDMELYDAARGLVASRRASAGGSS